LLARGETRHRRRVLGAVRAVGHDRGAGSDQVVGLRSKRSAELGSRGRAGSSDGRQARSGLVPRRLQCTMLGIALLLDAVQATRLDLYLGPAVIGCQHLDLARLLARRRWRVLLPWLGALGREGRRRRSQVELFLLRRRHVQVRTSQPRGGLRTSNRAEAVRRWLLVRWLKKVPAACLRGEKLLSVVISLY